MVREFRIIAEGDFACFTRPELKVERVSYDVPTPGALEGMLKSIYWKPAIRYAIDKIVVFNPIKFVNIRRNEVKNKVDYQKMKKQSMGDTRSDPCIYTSEVRSQRNSLVLKNVRYGVEFHIEQTGKRNERELSECDPQKKHEGELERRINKGQYFRTPCFGCAEFSVKNIVLVESFPLREVSDENTGVRDLGFMLDRMEFADHGDPVNNDWENPKFRDKATAHFYRPVMHDGVIDVTSCREESLCS